jgi:hypothetical protein
MIERPELFKRISSDIERVGYHLTLVAGNILPRFAYTIGGINTFGSELIFAGGELYSRYDLSNIFSHAFDELKRGVQWKDVSIDLGSLGTFSLSLVHRSWCKLLALDAFDFYNEQEIKALQILPDRKHHTLDIPDLSTEFEGESNPVWQWLTREWDVPIPNDSMAVTNIEVLFGTRATEVMRWEENEWEIYAGAGPDVPKEDMRTVPLAVLTGIDKSLEPAMHLPIGKGLWRDPIALVWNNWG